MAKLFEVEPHVRAMIDADGAVLLDLQAGKYYSLNGMGAQIWTKAMDGEEEAAIVKTICELYGAPEERVRADVRAFVSGLEKKGLIRALA